MGIDKLNTYSPIEASGSYPAAPWVSGNIAHNPDGSRSVVITVDIFFATISGGDGHGARVSASKTVELTTIPRASIITEAAATALGGSCAVKWTPMAASFRYRLKFSLGTWNMESAVLYPGSTAAYTYRAVIPLEVAKQIPNGPDGTMTVTLLTYSDSEASVQVGDADKEIFTVTVPNNRDTQPDPGMTLQPVSSLPSAFAELYIQGKTKVDANFSGSGKYGASVTGYSMTVEGKSFSSPYTSDYLLQTGSVAVKGTATDTRGYPGTETQSISVIPYTDPKIQVSVCGRCDAIGNLSDSGTYLRIRAKSTYSKVEDASGIQRNACRIEYRCGPVGSDYGEWVTILPAKSGSDEVDTGALLGGALSATTSYLVQIRAVDDIGGEALTTFSIPTEKVYLHKNGPKNSLGIGGYEENENTVSVAEGMTLNVKGKVFGIMPVQQWSLGSGEGATYEAVTNRWHDISEGAFSIDLRSDTYPYRGFAIGYKWNDSFGSFVLMHYGGSDNGGTIQYINMYGAIPYVSAL